MLSDIHSQDLIRWADAADSFFCLFYFSFLLFSIKFLIVLDHERFARETLLWWFEHQKFASFVRPPLWHWRNWTLGFCPWELPQSPTWSSLFDSPKKGNLQQQPDFGSRRKRASGQRDSVLTEDWWSLRLNIQVRGGACVFLLPHWWNLSFFILRAIRSTRFEKPYLSSTHPHPHGPFLTIRCDNWRESTRTHRCID